MYNNILNVNFVNRLISSTGPIIEFRHRYGGIDTLSTVDRALMVKKYTR